MQWLFYFLLLISVSYCSRQCWYVSHEAAVRFIKGKVEDGELSEREGMARLGDCEKCKLEYSKFKEEDIEPFIEKIMNSCSIDDHEQAFEIVRKAIRDYKISVPDGKDALGECKPCLECFEGYFEKVTVLFLCVGTAYTLGESGKTLNKILYHQENEMKFSQMHASIQCIGYF